MISEIIRLSAIYVLARVLMELVFPSSRLIIKYLFYTGLVLTIVGAVGPQFNRMTSDLHDVAVTYTQAKKVVGVASDGLDAVGSWPDTKENIPYIGTGSSKFPPGITFMEKLRPSTIRFSYPLSGTITQEFKGEDHHGIDIACTEGTIVKISREGKVLATGFDETYGNFVQVDHGGGWSTLYAHLSKVMVKEGDRLWGNLVQLGLSGNTGFSTGPHLHFEIRVGNKAIDPKEWMK